MQKSRKWIALMSVAVMLWLASMACAGPFNPPTKTPTDTPTTTLTNTPTETLTSTPTITPTPTDTPIHCAMVNSRFIDTSGSINFSYVPPAGWKQAPSNLGGCTGWNGPGGSVATLDFEGISGNGGSAAAFGQAFVEKLGENAEGLNVIAAEPFQTDSGIDSYRVIYELEMSGYKWHSDTYFFSDQGYFVIGMYMRMADYSEELDAKVEACMMTVEIG